MPTSLASLLGRSPAWFPITGATTAVPNRRYIATVTAATDVTLPTFTAGDAFVVANSRDSTAAIRVVVGAGNTINHPSFATGDNITAQPGESISLVAESTTELDLVTAGAVGPPGEQGSDGIDYVQGTAPPSPVDGEVWLDTSVNVEALLNDRVRGTVRITVGTTAPSSPAVGDIWIDTN